MAKFCDNCGAELKEEQDVCLGCGKALRKAKSGHNGYFISTSIIMLVIAFCLFCAFAYNEGDQPLVYLVPALFATAAGILCLAGKKNKAAVITSGALYIAGAVSNIIGIEDISLFTILALVFAGINIGFGCKMKN
jgi:hypothetical protein